MKKKRESDKDATAVLKRGMGLQQMLNAASEILGNPIVMFDIAYNLLCYTENIVTDDPPWIELTTQGKFSHQTVDFFNEEKFIEQYAESDVVSYMHSAKLKYDRMNAKLFDADGVQIGDIVLTACQREIEEDDFGLLEAVSKELSVELCASELYKGIGRIFPKSLVNDLLEGKAADSPVMEAAVRDFYSGLKVNLYVAVVDFTKYESTLTHLVYFQELFQDLQSEYKYFVHLNNVVMILSTDSPVLTVQKDLRKLNAFFLKYNIYCGISDSFQNICDLQKHYKRAISALNQGMSTLCVQHIFKYDDFRLDCYLSTNAGEEVLSGLFNPVVALIREYDKARGTEYAETIHAYLLAGRDMAAAMGVLGTTREALRARLKEITELFGVDWSDGYLIHSIFTTLKLQENHLV